MTLETQPKRFIELTFIGFLSKVLSINNFNRFLFVKQSDLEIYSRSEALCNVCEC